MPLICAIGWQIAFGPFSENGTRSASNWNPLKVTLIESTLLICGRSGGLTVSLLPVHKNTVALPLILHAHHYNREAFRLFCINVTFFDVLLAPEAMVYR